MLLHLGKESVIPLKEVIAIIDSKSALKSDYTKSFFERAVKEGNLVHLTDEVKTYILTERIEKKNGNAKPTKKSIVYTSNISSTTLKKRSAFMDDMINL